MSTVRDQLFKQTLNAQRPTLNVSTWNGGGSAAPLARRSLGEGGEGDVNDSPKALNNKHKESEVESRDELAF